MNYKGEDIDIRTPQGWSGSGRDGYGAGDSPGPVFSSRTTYNGGRAEPLWVDDVVLSCLNHALDLALAHRSPELRPEHLLSALTLNPTAGHDLEAHGIAVAALRRESATVVATAMPVVLAEGRWPRTSEAVEAILRHASERAYSRRAPVSVATLLETMTDMKQDLTGLDLLRRHAARKSARFNAPEDHHREPAAAAPAAHSGADSRLDALEDLVRNLTQELAAERHRNAAAPRRPVAARLRSESDDEALKLVAERLESIESGIDERFTDLAGGWVDIADRLRDVERKVDQRPEFTGLTASSEAVDEKLGALEQTFGLLLDRLTGLERKLDGRAGSQLEIAPVVDMIAGLETKTSENASGTRAVFERIAALERKIDAFASRPAADASALDERFGLLAEQVGEQSTRAVVQQFQPLHQSLSAFERRISETSGRDGSVDELNSSVQSLTTSVDQWRLDQTGDIGQVANRLQAIEAETAGLHTTIETMASNIGVVYAILSRREENKSKVKNWLFGTDDWYSASWDTERWREQMIAAGGFVPMPRRRQKQVISRI